MTQTLPLHLALEIPGAAELLQQDQSCGNYVEVEIREGRAISVYSWTDIDPEDESADIGLRF